MGNAWSSRRKNDLRLLLRRRFRCEVVRIATDPRYADTLLDLRLDQLFSALGVTLALDVGAQVGDYAALLRRNGFQRRIISFEPVAANYDALCRRAQDDPLWQCVNVALGSEDAEDAEVDHVERVAVRRLDHVLPESAGTDRLPPTFLKWTRRVGLSRSWREPLAS